MSDAPRKTESDLADLFDLLIEKMKAGLNDNPTPALFTAISKFLKDQDVTCADDITGLEDLAAGMRDTEAEIESKFNG